jgi:uncharacterized protein (TIGR03435 family)
MSLFRAVSWGLLVFSGVGVTQNGDKKPEFDVVSVRENRTRSKPTSNFSLDSGNIFSVVGKEDVFVPAGGTFSASGQPLLSYISFAYSLTGTQFLALRFKEFVGAAGSLPDWFAGARFDIQARVEGNPSKDQVRQMMQALLADRFKLAVHMETRQVPVFGLKRVKAGLTLHPHRDGDACASGLPAAAGVIAHVPPTLPGRASFGGCAVPLALLAGAFPTQTGMATVSRPVIDETGMMGNYDFVLEWALDPSDTSGPGFQEALQNQLGLKLVPEKGPVEILVIDHVERPSAN